MSDRMEFRGAQGDLEIYIPSHSLWKSKLQSWHNILLADTQCKMDQYKVSCHLLTTREDRWTEWQVTWCTTIRNSTEIYCFTSSTLKVKFKMSKDKYALALYGALYIKTKVKQIQQHQTTVTLMMTAPFHWIQKVTLSPPQVQTAWIRAETAYESPGSETQGKSLPSTNWLWPSGSDEQVPPSPPQLIE